MHVGDTGVVVDPNDVSVRVDGSGVVVTGMIAAKLQLVTDPAAYATVKVGDIFPLSEQLRDSCGSFCGNTAIVQIKVTSLDSDNPEYMHYEGLNADGGREKSCSMCIKVGSLIKLNQSTNQMQNITLVEKAKLASKTEPLQSFIKLGVTNSDGVLTPDGQQLFFGWLITKHGDEFKTDVIDPILKFEADNKQS